jgi:hypothetical protein
MVRRMTTKVNQRAEGDDGDTVNATVGRVLDD